MMILRALVTASLIFTLCSCATSDKQTQLGPVERVFEAPYDQVWRAMQLALAKYPRKVDDVESGTLETETLKGDQAWDPPFVRTHKPTGYRQKLQVRLIKGEYDGKPAIKVLISKQSEMVRNFFSEPEPVDNDGLEERVLLYRIDRELRIDQAIQRSVKNKQKDHST